MNESTVILIMEFIGTVAFSVSGSLIAIKYCLDLFGVILVGCITAVGGGMLRDIFLGELPPAIFFNSKLILIAMVTSLIVFVISYVNLKKFEILEKQIENVNNFFDAVGLAAFSVAGTQIAFNSGFSEMIFLCISMGMLTGIGGGIIRDILVDKTPSVLKKHIYALASLLGSTLYYSIRISGYPTLAIVVALPSVIIIRMLAAKYHWELPKIKFK